MGPWAYQPTNRNKKKIKSRWSIMLNIYLLYWNFKKTGVKTLKTCCKATTDHHDQHCSMKLLRTFFYYNMHLQYFFSENSFIIVLKTIVFRMSFSLPLNDSQFKWCWPIVLQSTFFMTFSLEKKTRSHVTSYTWTLVVQFQRSRILISHCPKLFFCTFRESLRILIKTHEVLEMLTLI